MTTQEFSVEFDILYNNITSGQAPGLTEYEKSVFLTQALEATVTDMYAGRSVDGFEATEENRAYLNTLLRQFTKNSGLIEKENPQYYIEYIFPLSQDVLFIVNETITLEDDSLSCKGSNKRIADVYPVTFDTLYRTVKSPFRGPNERRVLRLDSKAEGKRTVRLISKYKIADYTVNYIKRPNPIILENLEEGLFINGMSTVSECELPDILHRAVLLKAVELAKAVWKN